MLALKAKTMYDNIDAHPKEVLGKGDNMSLGIALKGSEGIVLAADSRVTITAERAKMIIPATYDNATKLLKVQGQDFVGAITYGAGAINTPIGPRTAHSLLPEFESELLKEKLGRLPVEDFAKRLSKFYLDQWNASPPAGKTGDMIFLIGGYDEGSPYGSTYEIHIPSRPEPLGQLTGDAEFGLLWGGQKEIVERLILGFDGGLIGFLKTKFNVSDPDAQALTEELKGRLGIALPIAFLPLQDCIDLAIQLIRTTIAIQAYTVGIRGVGGAIDIAAITRTKGYREIQTKSIRGERNAL